MQVLKIRRIGNSLGATLPKQVLDRLKVSEGDTLYLTETPSGFEITPYDEAFVKALGLRPPEKVCYMSGQRQWKLRSDLITSRS